MTPVSALFLFLVVVALVSCEEEKSSDPLKKADTLESGRHLPLEEDYDYAEELQGKQNSGNVIEEHSTDMHHDKGGHQDFGSGGSNYNKQHKENVADNKELENVKQHDAGEKFGAEALKEHKLGKHKEKSKGHKLHGFKNTYHKEEYGDHKTFHDEFLDTDHHHNYDDHHEHRQLQGGKFTKGFKHEGKNKNFDESDQREEWGKDGHDGYDDAKYERGKHGSKHVREHDSEGKNYHHKQNSPQYYENQQYHADVPHEGDFIQDRKNIPFYPASENNIQSFDARQHRGGPLNIHQQRKNSMTYLPLENNTPRHLLTYDSRQSQPLGRPRSIIQERRSRISYLPSENNTPKQLHAYDDRQTRGWPQDITRGRMSYIPPENNAPRHLPSFDARQHHGWPEPEQMYPPQNRRAYHPTNEPRHARFDAGPYHKSHQ